MDRLLFSVLLHHEHEVAGVRRLHELALLHQQLLLLLQRLQRRRAAAVHRLPLYRKLEILVALLKELQLLHALHVLHRNLLLHHAVLKRS